MFHVSDLSYQGPYCRRAAVDLSSVHLDLITPTIVSPEELLTDSFISGTTHSYNTKDRSCAVSGWRKLLVRKLSVSNDSTWLVRSLQVRDHDLVGQLDLESFYNGSVSTLCSQKESGSYQPSPTREYFPLSNTVGVVFSTLCADAQGLRADKRQNPGL
jgi:hypothetical protein